MRIVIVPRGKLQAGAGVKLHKSDANTIVRTRASTESSAGSGIANELHYNDGTVKIDIDGNGIVMEMLWNGDKISFDGINGWFEMYDHSSGNTLRIETADMFWGDYRMRETGLFEGGVPVSAYVLRTETF